MPGSRRGEAGRDDRHDAVKRIFVEATERPRSERVAYVTAACGDDELARVRVMALLAACEDEVGGAFMDSPTGGGTANIAPLAAASPGSFTQPEELAEGPGTVIGPYKLLQRIGEGGFGVVFMAEQERPVRRRVALKIIKLGMDTRQVVARFEQERQALALMDHPHIAKVLDAGATRTGRPYFVMELCQGDAITQYCDTNSLSVPERLELMEQVCLAVQHAHQKGVIHRDLKPSNVLVSMQDGRPFAKVIDFGIAKATSARLTEKTLFTEHRQLIGTPEYMSPEQAEGSLDIDTRTDVYSLGVLLYELLTGCTPFDSRRLRAAAYAELQRIIREVEPPAPSTRLSQSRELIAGIATRRRSEPRKLGAIVRGELDWIVMKALDKDRKRRYESASALAEDIDRYLSGAAVRAAPPSRTYRVGKFVRRHRGVVMAATLIVVALLVGIVGTGYGMITAERQEAAAVQARREAEIITGFLSDMLESPAPDAQGRDVSMRAVLDEASGTIATRLEGFPIAESQLRRTIGNAYRSLGELDRASDHLRGALEIRERVLGRRHRETVRARADLAGLRQQEGRYDDAERLANEALGDWEGDPDAALILGLRNNLAQTFVRQGRLPEAIKMQRKVVEGMRRARGPTDGDTIGVSVNFASMLQGVGERAEAERILVSVADDAVRALGQDHPTALFARSELAGFLLQERRYAEAEPILRDTLDRRVRVLGERHPHVGRTYANLGLVLDGLGKGSEGRALLERGWANLEAALGPAHRDTIETAINLLERIEQVGWPADESGRVASVIASIREIVAADRVASVTLNSGAWFLLNVEPVSLRDPAVALRAAERACAQSRTMDDPDLWSYLDTYALALARNGDFPHAVTTQRESIERLPKDQEHFRGEMEARLREYQAALPAEPVHGPRRSGMGDGGST
ncbi:MAG: serine/threonine protein kinase [Phycisphaerae bacterium]|nr:serine/threonine protein kinase [Phycisphaerae bacterium]